MRFELTTPTLARLCSTPELRPHPLRFVFTKCARVIAQLDEKCNSLFCPNRIFIYFIGHKPMNQEQQSLFDRFDELDIQTKTHQHQPAFTVEEARELRGSIQGSHCRNLFLKDKKGQIWLIVCLEDATINLKTAPLRIGSARLSFGKPELMDETLKLTPGSVTPFGLINDKNTVVNVILEKTMMAKEMLNFHPLINTATTTITSNDLLKFIHSCGHTPQIIDLMDI